MTVASNSEPDDSAASDPERQPPEVSESGVLDNRVRLRQPINGYRAGLDAALLAAAVAAKPADRVFEAGCGAGAVLMQIAARRPGVLLKGLERDAYAAALGRENARLNGVADRVSVMTGDVSAGIAPVDVMTFDWAVSNPPFFDDASALRAPSPGKRGAWMADDGLAAWIGVLLKAVREGGRVVLIHRADRLADLLSLLGAKAGSFVIQPIHPFADQPAKRVIVSAIRTSKAPLRLLPPLVLHDRSGAKHTPQAEAVLRGEADLPL